MSKRLLQMLMIIIISSSQSAHAFDEANSDRINQLIETGMRYFRSGGDVKRAGDEIFNGIKFKDRYDLVEAAFKEASKLAPERLDFRYAVAFIQLYQKKVQEAKVTYQSIAERNPEAFDAQAWLEAIARLNQDYKAAELVHHGLAAIDQGRADTYRKRFLRAEQIIAEKPNFDLPSPTGVVTIVTFGYALSDDGTMQPPLMDRLELTLRAAQANPNSLVLVSGGVPKNGVTEADVMSEWLVERGIDRGRVIIEDKSRDTINNALNAATLLTRHKADAVVLITSSSHMRRARVLLEDALIQKGLSTVISPLSALDSKSIDEAAQVDAVERLAIYRDLMRVSGIWAYPGLQQ